MADYCQQCSASIGAPEGWSDLAGLFEEHDLAEPSCVAALCEGCGFTFVDVAGRCVGPHDLQHEPADGVVLWVQQ